MAVLYRRSNQLIKIVPLAFGIYESTTSSPSECFTFLAIGGPEAALMSEINVLAHDIDLISEQKIDQTLNWAYEQLAIGNREIVDSQQDEQ